MTGEDGRLTRAARVATVTLLLAFVVAVTAACACYPGGSWTLPSAQGFSLARNFWCDLLRSRAINGADNALGKQLGSVAFAALGSGLWPFWWVAATLLSRRRGQLVWRLGAASSAALIAMVLLPSDRHPIAHGVVALAGGVLGVMAAALSIGTRVPGEVRLSLRRCAGALALLLALLNALLYVHVAYLHGPDGVLLPSVQKLATASLLAWMLGTVARCARRAQAERRAHTSAV